VVLATAIPTGASATVDEHNTTNIAIVTGQLSRSLGAPAKHWPGLIRANDPKGVYRSRPDRVVRIAISVDAFEAIARTLPAGSVGYEAEVNEEGERLIWLDRAVVDRLRALRGPGESYSDVILQLAAEG
jgi:hypothetical protein